MKVIGTTMRKAANRLRLRIEHSVLLSESRKVRAHLGLRESSRTLPNLKQEVELYTILASVKAIIKGDINTLVDIGSHHGWFTRAFHEVFAVGTMLCYEPDVSKHAEIMKNLEGLSVEVSEKALSNRTCEANFFVHQDSTMNSLVEADHEVLRSYFPYDRERPKEVKVLTSTLDDEVSALSRSNNTKVFIKIDTQGNELDVLKGGLRVLESTEGILVEHMFLTPYKSSYEFAELVRFLDEHGFKCMGSFPPSLRQNFEVSGVDFLFVKR